MVDTSPCRATVVLVNATVGSTTGSVSNVHLRVSVVMPNLAAMQLRRLGLMPGASREQVKAAWRKAVKAAHPDLGGSPDAVRKLYDLRDGLKATGLL